jgi:hypothetical protein
MSNPTVNKRKIFNDPVYGFISIQNEVIFDLIEHPYFQRLRRIKQLGLTHLVYPGALHTRFHHSLGAMHLMQNAVSELRTKGHLITDDEAFGVEAAILLHDIGHGPYSHALENSIVQGIRHEEISLLFMERFSREFGDSLKLTKEIFSQTYPKRFLGKLVSSQLDMDRLDYLKRDSFFSGVSEGIINYERLLNMLNVVDDELVIEAKGIYSVEKFITARRLMYWQVYLHKTVLAAEYMLMQLLKRAKELSRKGDKLFASPTFSFFLKNEVNKELFYQDEEVLENFAKLDDYDIFSAMKVWKDHPDKILSTLSKSLVNRRLFKIEIKKDPFSEIYIEQIKQKTREKYQLSESETNYFVFEEKTSNFAYAPGPDKINILFKNGSVSDIANASEDLNISLLSHPTTKYFLCYPKDIL